MVLLDINQLQLAATTSDIVIKRDIERMVLYRRATLLAVATKLLPSRNFGVLDVKFQFPSDLAGKYPVPEGTMAALEGITWTDFNTTLEKAQVHYDITDEAKARQLADYQMQTGRRKASEALAELIDHHAIDMIVAGAYAGNLITVTAGDEWDSGNVTADPEQDVIDAVKNILSNSRVTLEDITHINMVVPTTVWGELRKLKLIGNVQQSLESYFKQSIGLGIYPTRYTDVITGMPTGISDDAYICVYTEDAGLIGFFNPPPGSGIPLTEVWRVNGVGERYLFTNYFKCKIQPLSSTVTTSPYIAKIANVATGP